jgi:hypothetical protein
MRQMTLAHQAEFQRYWKKTRREQFLAEMGAVMPWAGLLALVAPHYSKGEMGRKPVGLDITIPKNPAFTMLWNMNWPRRFYICPLAFGKSYSIAIANTLQ